MWETAQCDKFDECARACFRQGTRDRVYVRVLWSQWMVREAPAAAAVAAAAASLMLVDAL
jgi:hypothetical protein